MVQRVGGRTHGSDELQRHRRERPTLESYRSDGPSAGAVGEGAEAREGERRGDGRGRRDGKGGNGKAGRRIPTRRSPRPPSLETLDVLNSRGRGDGFQRRARRGPSKTFSACSARSAFRSS